MRQQDLVTSGLRAVDFVRRSSSVAVARVREEFWDYEEPADDGFERRPSLRRPAIAGIAAIVIGFGGFLIWGFTASLDSAAVAPGTVIVDSKKKTISHLEGGTLKSLLVAEGDTVKAGQPLLLLDDTRAAADFASGEGQRVGLVAKLARLRAEQSEATSIPFPDELKQNATPIAQSVIADETRLFAMRQDIYRGKVEVAEKQVEQYVAEAQAASAQASAYADQKALVGKQVENIRALVEKGAATARQQSDLEAQYAQIVGNAGQYAAETARAEQAEAGAKVALASVRMEWQGDIANDIQDTQLKLNDVEQRIAAARDVLDKLTVRAPQDGTVLNIQVRTPGSAVNAGEALLDIQPANEPLIVEAKLSPMDIDAVHLDAPVSVMLSGYDLRTHPPLDGKLTYIAADQTENEQKGIAYYTVRATIDMAALSAHPTMKLFPGMPAEVVVKRTPRKAIDYILDPLTRTFYRAFREE